MNIQLKQRLVGAVVLVALAVIFIPMLLPGEGDLTGGIAGSNIPPEPDYRFLPTAPAPKAPPMAASPSVPLDDKTLDEVIDKTFYSESSADAPSTSTAVADKPKAVDEPIPAKNAAPAKKTIAIKKSPVVTAKQKSPKASGWVVQVGSFSSHQNANEIGRAHV